jgi:benzil reductase ((S)-benzoin forming)
MYTWSMSRQVFITGVSSGIGLGLARECARRGDRVFALGRNPPPSTLPRLSFEACDLARLDTLPASLDRLLAGITRVDLAILNAGVLGRIADLGECSLEELKAIMEVNLWANKAVTDALLSGGREVVQVVAISSGAAVSGARGWNGYALSKAALNMLMRLYAAERPATHFSAFAPGLVDTAMQDKVRALPEDPRFPTVDRLKQAAGTPDMPDPDAAAPRLLDAMDRLRDRKSGDFHDIRSMD